MASAALRSLGRTTMPVVAIVGTVADAYGGRPDASPVESLADLVDWPTCHDVGGGYEFRCSGCGCVIHIFRDCVCGEDDSAMTVGGDPLYVPRYCPWCGAEVVEDAR